MGTSYFLGRRAMQAAISKLQFKGQKPVLVMYPPAEAAGLVEALGALEALEGDEPAQFFLAFAKDMDDAEDAVDVADEDLADGGLFWLAYPKQTSKKYPKTPIDRDSLHERLADLAWDGVSLVALDDDWSAMRFKRKD
jgi:hypothetical protein